MLEVKSIILMNSNDYVYTSEGSRSVVYNDDELKEALKYYDSLAGLMNDNCDVSGGDYINLEIDIKIELTYIACDDNCKRHVIMTDTCLFNTGNINIINQYKYVFS